VPGFGDRLMNEVPILVPGPTPSSTTRIMA